MNMKGILDEELGKFWEGTSPTLIKESTMMQNIIKRCREELEEILDKRYKESAEFNSITYARLHDKIIAFCPLEDKGEKKERSFDAAIKEIRELREADEEAERRMNNGAGKIIEQLEGIKKDVERLVSD